MMPWVTNASLGQVDFKNCSLVDRSSAFAKNNVIKSCASKRCKTNILNNDTDDSADDETDRNAGDDDNDELQL
jgi:hypothetical protein